MKKPLLECCTDSLESAIIAKEAGADRIELCANLVIGGTTPSISLFKLVKENECPPANILIRPRFGDFCYTDAEFEQIRRDVAIFRDAGANGVVIGILLPDGNLDYKRMEILVKEAGNLEVTLHRAFDVSKEPFKVLDECYKLGITSILTSGQDYCCYTGRELIKEMVAYCNEHFDGNLDVLVAGGVSANVIRQLSHYTGARSFHTSGKEILESPMQFRKEEVVMGVPSISEYEILRSNLNRVKNAVKAVREIV